uniref:Uncharacterized protein LOC113795291 n=1 Tax=Dermatophagoides pteronyssinus TaxID=6956 RepID=A0A6P6Y8F9_DERPT|nr:uncharacterized protein LOC113795291 [Dermatophagoides pteronyssinus]
MLGLPLNKAAPQPSYSRVLRSAEARSQLYAGVAELSEIVAKTMGPKGRNVIIERSFADPQITKDGVTVANAVTFKDPVKNMGANLVKSVTRKSNNVYGDGTTTATVLASAVFDACREHTDNGIDAIALYKTVQRLAENVIKCVKAAAKPATVDELYNVALISANYDADIAKIIADAYRKLGPGASITLSESKKPQHSVEYLAGLKLDNGFHSPYFVNDFANGSCNFDNSPAVLLLEGKLSNLAPFVPLLEQIAKRNGEVVIFADDVDEEVLKSLVVNQLKGVLRVCAVKHPAYGEQRKRLLQDLAAYTGAAIVNTSLLDEQQLVPPQSCGRARRVRVFSGECHLFKDDFHPEALRVHEAVLEQMLLRKNLSAGERTDIEARLATLRGKVGLIEVGGHSEVETEEARQRFDDALGAAKAALKSGLVPGGGIALYYAAKAACAPAHADDALTQIAKRVLLQACAVPATQICKNAGLSADELFAQLRQSSCDAFGFDARASEFCNLSKKGIVDPCAIVADALRNAVSVAALLATTEATICAATDAT